VVCQLSNILYA